MHQNPKRNLIMQCKKSRALYCHPGRVVSYTTEELINHVYLKPQSDIHCNRSATSPWPNLNSKESQRSQLGFAVGQRLIRDWLPTDQRLVGDLVVTSLRLDATGQGPVLDKSPTSPRSVADQVLNPPWGRRGFKSRICPPYPQRVVKGD